MEDKQNAAWFDEAAPKVERLDMFDLREKVADLERRLKALEQTNCNTQGCCLE